MGLINYVKQLWDTTSFVNPTRLNHMEDGIKATADYADGIAYAECPTARNVVAKVVTCADFKLRVGAKITVRFTATDTSNPTSGNVTLNVNGTGAKGVILGKSNKTAVAYSLCGELYNNQVQEFVYDGTYWVWTNRDTNTTYDGSSLKTKVAKTGSGTTITNTISASTTMDNVIGTLLNNDVALNSSLAAFLKDYGTVNNPRTDVVNTQGIYRYSNSAQDKPSEGLGGIVLSLIVDRASGSAKTIKIAIDTAGKIFTSVYLESTHTYGEWIEYLPSVTIGTKVTLPKTNVTSMPSGTETNIYRGVLPKGTYILSAKLWCANKPCFVNCQNLRFQPSSAVGYVTLSGVVVSDGTSNTNISYYQSSGSAVTRVYDYDNVFFTRIA